jgi:hypothetical protein
MARKGKTITHEGTEFEFTPTAQPVAIVAATDVKNPPAKAVGKETGSLASIAEPVDMVKKSGVKDMPAKVIGEEIGSEDWRISVGLDTSKKIMTAHVEFRGKTDDSMVTLADKAKTAALPHMMSFVESLPAENKITFKDLFSKDSSLKTEVERVLKNAVFSDIGSTGNGTPSFTLWVPVSEIRMAAGLESF